MIRNIIFSFLLLAITNLAAQNRDALVFFKDKDNVAASLANPNTILTQEAINRKSIHNIPIDERDVPLNENYKSTVSNQSGISVLAKSKWLNAVYVRGAVKDIQSLATLSFVDDIEFMDASLNRPFQPSRKTDKFKEEKILANYNYGNALNQTLMIGVDALHDSNYDGDGITIAFMDNGYPSILTNRAFAAMRQNNKLLGYYDFVNRIEDYEGSGSHGTYTLSTAAAYLDGEFVGTAPKASYYLFITEDGSQESPVEEAWWVEALERADSLGVFVTNTSLGYLDFDIPAYNYQYSDLDGQTTLSARGANIAFEKGMINVVSAGNEGAQFGYITTPADAIGAFTVGAVDAYGNRAWFSSHGPSFDGRIKPDVMAQGEGAAVVDLNGDVAYSNGTSFSGPIIAGAIASLWQVAPHLKNDFIMQAVRESADLYANPTALMGYGIPNFADALTQVQILNTEKHLRKELFAIYPNPVTDYFHISFPEHISNAIVNVYNILGQKLLEKEISNTDSKVNIEHLNSGIYLISINADNQIVGFKIVKQ